MDNDSSTLSMRKRIEQIKELPTLPEIADALFELRENPDAGINEMAKIIELDPSCSLQLMRYASSPFFGKRKINSIQEAITYIGFDKSLSLAIGFAAGQTFKIQAHGPVGLNNFWRHAVFSATLMQNLADIMPEFEDKPNSGLSYLCGLLHNIGFLLLGYQFPVDFTILNRKIKEQPHVAITKTEQDLLGARHTEIGVWLIRKWNLPPELTTTVFEHHNPSFRGDYWQYANLAFIANALLKAKGIGDADNADIPVTMRDSFGITEAHMSKAMERLERKHEELDSIINSLASVA